MRKYDGCINGPILREIRKKKKMTVDKVCDEIGISRSTLNQIEQGGRNLSLKTMYLLMDVYQVDANTILNIFSKDKDSIDEKLACVPKEKRDYLKQTFLFMIEQAMKDT